MVYPLMMLSSCQLGHSLPPAHIVASLSVASCMSGKPIRYLSDRQSYWGYWCTITVHEIEEVVEHQLTCGIRVSYICSYLLSRQSLRSDRPGHFLWGYHMTFTTLFGARPVHGRVQPGSPLRLRVGSSFLLCASRLRLWSRVDPFVPFELTE